MSISLLQLGKAVHLKVFVEFLSANEPLVFVSVKLACNFGLCCIVPLYYNEKDESWALTVDETTESWSVDQRIPYTAVYTNIWKLNESSWRRNLTADIKSRVIRFTRIINFSSHIPRLLNFGGHLLMRLMFTFACGLWSLNTSYLKKGCVLPSHVPFPEGLSGCWTTVVCVCVCM